MRTQTQSTNELTITEKMKIVQYLSILPAITIMVFMRRRVGFRLLKPSWLIGMAMFLWFINGICNINLLFFHPAGVIFSEFPLVMLAAGFLQRYRRWRELCAGQRWHTYSPGVSYLELLPLPAFFKAHRRIYRFLDPLICLVFAMLCGVFFSEALARWVACSSCALFVYEKSLYERQIENDLDTLDGLIVAEVQSETVEHFASSQSAEVQRTLEETAGIPVGVAHDVQKQIEYHRAKQAVKPERVSSETPVTRIVQLSVVAPQDKLAPPPDNMVNDAPDNPV